MSMRLSFIAEWYQEMAAVVRSFAISYFPADNSVEVYELRTKKTFLRRTKIPELSERDFFIGSKIDIFGRQFNIIDYNGDFTRNTVTEYRNKSFVILKPKILSKYFGKVLTAFQDSNICINNGMMVQFTPKTVSQFVSTDFPGNVQASIIKTELLSGPSIGLELLGENVTRNILICQRRHDTLTDHKIVPPAPLAEFFENEDMRNGIHCIEKDEDIHRLTKYFFEAQNQLRKNCIFNNSTLAVIKPHCIKDGNLGRIIDSILNNGFQITAMRMLLMARINCEEFYGVYRGILTEYIPMVAQLASGVCMCLEIAATDATKFTQKEFRDFCGPMDPEIAKILRPYTLRAYYGRSRVLNALHCTDLPDDTNLELEYAFEILD